VREVKLSLRDSARLVIEEVIIFWQKARIPNREIRHCIPKLEAMYNEWRNLQINSCRRTDTQIKKENIFIDKFEDLFDIAHSDAMNMISNEIDKQFLNCQRQKGRPGSLIGIDLTSHKSEQKKYIRLQESENRKKRAHDEINVLCKYLVTYYLLFNYNKCLRTIFSDETAELMSTESDTDDDNFVFEETICLPGPSTNK